MRETGKQLLLLPSSGIKIAVTEKGTGPVLIFVHGLSMNHSCWDLNMNHLSRTHRCIAFDLPGHGDSQKGELPYSIPFFGEVLKELLEVLRIDKYSIVAHSMGAQVVLFMTAKKLIKPERLILAAPAGFEKFSDQEKQALIEFSEKQNDHDLTDAQLYYIASLNYAGLNLRIQKEKEELKKLISEFGQKGYFTMLRKCLKGMLDEPVYILLKEIKVPVMVLIGEKDKLIPNKILHPFLTPLAVGSDGCASLPDCRLHMISEAGHLLQAEKSDEFNQEVTSFLKD